MRTLVPFIGVIGLLGFVVFLVLTIISLIRKKNLKRNLIGFFACFAIFVVALSAFPEDQSAEDSADKESSNQPSVSVENDVPSDQNANPEYDLEISATDLLEAYDANAVAADKKYDGKNLKVSGTVGDIDKDVLNSVYVTLINDDKISFISVQCYFSNNDEIDKVAELQSGDVISVIGKCDGQSLNVILRKCKIVD